MTATLVIAGDLCASGRVGAGLSAPDARSVWGDIRTIAEAADFAVVNLECPLTDWPEPILKSGPCLWGPPKSALGIRAAGFTAVSLANNHILDAGPAGVCQTIHACQEAGLICVGAGEDHISATVPLTTMVGDIKLCVLAFAENEFSTTTGSSPGAWPFDLVDNAAQIARAHQASDYVLVLFHGGAENYPLPSPKMQKACRFFVDAGADAVVCHHSHVVGGNELYKGRPIVYGTGNLLFGAVAEVDAGWFTGTLVQLQATRHETLQLQLLPYRQDPMAPSVTPLTGAEGEFLHSRIDALNAVIADQDRLRKSWALFCRERRSHFLSSILCLTKPESWLLDKGLLPSVLLRLNQRRLAKLKNLFSCESHAESCEQMLRDMLEKEG